MAARRSHWVQRSWPSTVTELSGRARGHRSRVTSFRTVLLPEPFGPTTATCWPAGITREKSSRIVAPSRMTVTCEKASKASDMSSPSMVAVVSRVRPTVSAREPARRVATCVVNKDTATTGPWSMAPRHRLSCGRGERKIRAAASARPRSSDGGATACRVHRRKHGQCVCSLGSADRLGLAVRPRLCRVDRCRARCRSCTPRTRPLRPSASTAVTFKPEPPLSSYVAIRRLESANDRHNKAAWLVVRTWLQGRDVHVGGAGRRWVRTDPEAGPARDARQGSAGPSRRPRRAAAA